MKRKRERGREGEREWEIGGRERDKEREREWEIGGEREREIDKEMLNCYLKGMKGALAPFSYLV